MELTKCWGFRTENHEGYVGTADLNDRDDGLHILAHLDVVAAGDGWDTNPYCLVRDGDLIYGRGTDLGTALEEICARRPPILGAGSTLLILSDTKTIDQNRAVRAVLEAKRQAARVIWLNPIPEGKWQYLRSVQTMAALVPMLSCSTLRELAAAGRRLAQL